MSLLIANIQTFMNIESSRNLDLQIGGLIDLGHLLTKP